MSGASLQATTPLAEIRDMLRPVESQACARTCVLARHPGSVIIRGARGYVVLTEDGMVLGEGRMPAYWHEEAWINAIEEVEGR